ncbi:hypothetical protein [Armatimonas sp.]|uniref:hypothetical protein n=1 Tax=Armatimonas sp. TaxID=1872638 RepID=UPI0037518761
MSLYDNLEQFEQKKALDSAGGRATTSLVNLGYSAEMERSLPHMPIVAKNRIALQGNNGRFLFKVNDDGTRTAGSFYIDSFGRFVSY